MKPKKSKLSFGPNGLKGFFMEHVEKMVLGLVLVLVVAFVYLGSTVETFPESKSPATLQEVVNRAQINIDQKTFDKVKETLVPPSIDNPIVIRTRPEEFELATLNVPIQPARTKRRDPALYPPSKLEVYAVTAPVAMLPVEDELMPIDRRYLEMVERQQQPLVQEDPLMDERGKKKKSTKKAGRPGDEFDPLAGVRGAGMGALGSNTPRQLTDEDREELLGTQARISTSGVARSRNIVSLKAVIPFKKQLNEYTDALGGNAAYYSEERDTPTYVFFKVERADVTANPDADPASLKWTLLSTNAARNLPYVEGAEWEQIPEELVDPAAVLPASERFGALTLPVPPALLTDLKKLAGHSDVSWASELTGEGLAGDTTKKGGPAAAVEGPDAEGPEGPESPDAFTGPRVGGEGPTGPSRGPGNPYRGGRMGESYGGSTTQEVTYKLFRFIDFDVQRGHKYRYRVSLMLEDPNHPQVVATGSAVNVRDGGGSNTNDPHPASLDKTVEQRLLTLKQQEDKSGKRVWYRETEWSEASPVISVDDPSMLVGGPVTAGRETPIPGTSARVATGESVGKALVVQWNDLLATNVVAEEEVQRGSVLNFTKDAEALHPVKLEYVELKDQPIKTDGIVVDIRGGERLPGGGAASPTSTAPGKMAVIDSSGKLIVLDEARDLKLWHRHGKVEARKVAEPEPEDTPYDLESPRPRRSSRGS